MNDIPDITGEKLITAAYLFGSAGVIFATLPFIGVIIAGIVKANQGGNHNKSIDILTVVAWAFVVHAVSSFLYMGLILVLDYLHLDTPNFYTTKVFPIFWAETQAQVYSLAGVSGGDGEDILSGVAYATLHLAQVVTINFFLIMPLAVFVLALFYGAVLSSRDSYDNNVMSFLAYSSIAFISVTLMYFFWAYIGSFAMFMPNGMDIIGLVNKIYSELLKV